jgi:hypothetical protein
MQNHKMTWILAFKSSRDVFANSPRSFSGLLPTMECMTGKDTAHTHTHKLKSYTLTILRALMSQAEDSAGVQRGAQGFQMTTIPSCTKIAKECSVWGTTSQRVFSVTQENTKEQDIISEKNQSSLEQKLYWKSCVSKNCTQENFTFSWCSDQHTSMNKQAPNFQQRTNTFLVLQT